MCSSSCSGAYNNKSKAKCTYGICGNPGGGGGGTFYETFAIYRKYKCYDDNNNLLPKPETNGVSAEVAETPDSSASVTLKFKYTAKVDNGDKCQVWDCKAYVDGSKVAEWRCNQDKDSGKSISISKSVKVKKGKHEYYLKVVSERLYSLFN